MLDESLMDYLDLFIQRQVTHLPPFRSDLIQVDSWPEKGLDFFQTSWASFEFIVIFFRRELINFLVISSGLLDLLIDILSPPLKIRS